MATSPIAPARLTVELVPEPCWWSNVRTLVDKPVWDRLRRQVYRAARYRCEVCTGRGPDHPVEAHEVWDYDDRQRIQRLVRMVALCPACHEVKHLGLANVRGRGDQALAHLARVNRWSPQLAERYAAAAFATWARRSEHPWRLELAGLGAYLSSDELAAVLAHIRAQTDRVVR